MWTKPVLVLITLALVGSSSVQNNPWKANQEYTYDFYARTLTSMPDLNERNVGLVTKGRLILQAQTDDKIIAKITKCGTAHLNEKLDDWTDEIPEELLSFEKSTLSGKVFVIEHKNGAVENVAVDSSTSNDEVNQLKAIISTLQIDVNGENLIKSNRNQKPEQSQRPSAYFKTMEPSIMGQCETTYSVNPIADVMVAQAQQSWAPNNIDMKHVEGDLVEISKYVNFEKCSVAKVYHAGLTRASDVKVNSNQQGFLSKSAVTKVIASGPLDKLTIQQATTDNRVSASPDMYQEQQAQVVSQIQITLNKVQKISEKLQAPHNENQVGDLVYRYNSPSDKENQPKVGRSFGLRHHENDNSNSDSSCSDSSSDSSSNSCQEEEQYQKHGKRSTRSITDEQRNNIKQNRRNQNSFGSNENRNEQNRSLKYQQRPTLMAAPETPLMAFTVGNQGKSIKHDSKVDLENSVRNLIKEIAEDLQNQDDIPKRNTLEKYEIAVELIRLMSVEKIRSVAQQLKVENGNKGTVEEVLRRQTFEDAVAQAATGPAVVVVSSWISEGQVQGERKIGLFTSLTNSLSTPTEQIIRELFEKVIKNNKIRNDRQIYSSVSIAFTDLIRRAYSDKELAENYYPTKAYGSFDRELHQFVKTEVIEYFSQNLDAAIHENNDIKVLLNIRSLANIAHPSVMDILKKYFDESTKLNKFQRLALVLSLNKFTDNHPNNIRDVLYKIVLNTNETPEIRSASVVLFMRTAPSAPKLQRMAQLSNDDPSQAVRSTIKSAILSASELEGANNADLAASAQAAVPFLTEEDFGTQYSKTHLRDYDSNNLNLAYESQLTHIMGSDHVSPKGIWYDAYKIFGGFSTKDSEMQLMLSSVDQILNLLTNLNQDNKSGKEHSHSENGKKSGQNSQWSIKRIAEQLNLNAGKPEDFQGQMLFNLMGSKRFYTFDQQSLKEIPQVIADGVEMIRNGKQITYNRFYDRRQVTQNFPLATGYIFQYTLRQPTLLQAIGDVQGRTQPDLSKNPSWKQLAQIESVSVKAKVHLVYSTEQISNVGFLTPFNRQQYTAGFVRKMQVHLPVELDIDADLKNNKYSAKLQPIDGKTDFKVFHTSAWPYILRKSVFDLRPAAESKDVVVIKSRPTRSDIKKIGKESTGMVFQMKSEHQLPAESIQEYNKMLMKQGLDALSRMPNNYQYLMQNIMNNNQFTMYDLLPYAFQPAMFETNPAQAFLSLAAMPYYEELSTEEIIRAQGLLSMISLPFGDAATLGTALRNKGGIALSSDPWPTNTLDHYLIDIKYDAARSANHQIKFNFALDKAYNNEAQSQSQHQRAKPAGSIDEKKLAMAHDPSPKSQERLAQLLENSAYQINQASAGVFDFSIVFDGEKRAEYVATIAQAGSLADEKERVLLFLSSKPAQRAEAIKMGITYTGKYQNTPDLSFERALHNDAKSAAKIHVVWSNKSGNDGRIYLNANMEQTKPYKQYIEKSQAAIQCRRHIKQNNFATPDCLNATYHANLMDKLEYTIEYENLPQELKNVTSQIGSLMQFIGFYGLEENPAQKGQSNRVEGTLRMAPHAKSLNFTMQTESKKLRFEDIPIQPQLRKLFTIHPGKSQIELMRRSSEQNGYVCTMNQDHIYTFDDSKIQQGKLGKCWHAMVHTQFPKYRTQKLQQQSEQSDLISILVRDSSEEANQKETQILVGQINAEAHQIHIKPSNGHDQVYEINVNGNIKHVSNEKSVDVYDQEDDQQQNQRPAIRIVQQSQELLVQIRNQMEIVYSGKSVLVRADSLYRNSTYGLCGTYNGEQFDDLLTPRNCVLENEKYFTASWALIDDKCDSETKQMWEKSQQANCFSLELHNRVPAIKTNPKTKKVDWDSSDSSSSSSSGSSSSSESGSSSSSSSEENRNGNGNGKNKQSRNNKCEIKKQNQYVQRNGRTCVTLEKVPTCQSSCRAREEDSVKYATRCFDDESSQAKSFRQQIRKGVSPRIDESMGASEFHQFNVPRNCVSRN